MGLLSIFGLLSLKIWYSLHKDDSIARKVHGLLTEVSKLKGVTKQLSAPQEAPDVPAGVVMPDITNMTLESFIQTMGFDAKELNNPIIKPLAEKMFTQMKTKMLSGKSGNSDVEGY
jgi:hypothetical protein